MSASSQTWQPENMALKRGGSKRQKCNDRHFVIVRLFRNLITLPTDVSKSCNLSECCLHSFKHSKIYNRAKTKTCHLTWPLSRIIQQRVFRICFREDRMNIGDWGAFISSNCLRRILIIIIITATIQSPPHSGWRPRGLLFQ